MGACVRRHGTTSLIGNGDSNIFWQLWCCFVAFPAAIRECWWNVLIKRVVFRREKGAIHERALPSWVGWTIKCINVKFWLNECIKLTRRRGRAICGESTETTTAEGVDVRFLETHEKTNKTRGTKHTTANGACIKFQIMCAMNISQRGGRGSSQTKLLTGQWRTGFIGFMESEGKTAKNKKYNQCTWLVSLSLPDVYIRKTSKCRAMFLWLQNFIKPCV